MKKLLLLISSTITLNAAAQWSDTNNNFEDSLHMPVSTAASTQTNPFVLTSYPDGGYFVIWEDNRNLATTNTDIYAQKYDKTGRRLWAVDGVPVSTGVNRQYYAFSSNQDYRNRSFAATDSAGGFYITYADDSVTNYYWSRMTVQHMRSNGTRVFADPGYIIAQSGGESYSFSMPELIADGSKGFFIAYKQSYGNDYIHVYSYRDENGTLKYYGGGRVNENAIQTSAVAPCGIKTDVVFPGTTVSDYNIWPDGQGGCNVIMNMSGNTTDQHVMLTYNRVWRAKKDSKVRTYFRNTSGTACPRNIEYAKGEVYLLYHIAEDYQSVFCGGGTGPLYAYTNYRLLSNGYIPIDISAYDYNYPKGVTLLTDSNINVNVIAVTRRSYDNNVLSDFTVQGYAYPVEKFDSVPYQRSSYDNPDFGYNGTPPDDLKKLNFFRDTLLGFSPYYCDFSLAAGGKHAYASALMGPYGSRIVRLQNLELSRKAADSFALEYKTSISSVPEKAGVAIGAEASTGFGGSSISYDHPLVTVSKNGQGFFYIREYYRSARVSPIGSGAELSWGAMGRLISTGYYNGTPYNLEQPVSTFGATDSSGIIAWKDNKNISLNSGDNIFIRHLNKLNTFNYLPPPKKIKPLYYYSAETVANPVVLLGSSKQYSPFEVYNSYNNTGTSPVVEIKDNINLGAVQVHAYPNFNVIRRYNNQPYLDRNYTIKVDSSIAAGSVIDMLLYFSIEEFNALKAADLTIADPGYLVVVRQPNTTATAPPAYTPVSGEELITPEAWDLVDGGYVIRIKASGFGNFFFLKIPTTTLCTATSTTFTSNVAGAAYQWEVSTGGNFLPVSNNTNYSGATTATLHINNIPSSFNGNRYRCVIDNTKVSNAFYLQIGNSWLGTVNDLWENPGNWGCGTVPDANTDVIINSGTVMVNSNASCRSLRVNPGANVSVAPGFRLTVTH